MPHIILEIPRALTLNQSLSILLTNVYNVVSQISSVNGDDIKSRIVLLDEWQVGDGSKLHKMFVHVRCILTKPRPIEDQKSISNVILEEVIKFFSENKIYSSIVFSIETTVLNTDNHFKIEVANNDIN